MHRHAQSRRDALKLLAAGPTLAAFAAFPALAQTDAALLTYEGPDRAGLLAAAARKDGTFTFYTSIAEKDLPVIIDPFERKYGVKVRVWRASTEKVLQRTLTEASARRYDVDAIHISSPE